MSKKRKVEASKVNVVDETETTGRGTRGSMPLRGMPRCDTFSQYIGTAYVCITNCDGSVLRRNGTIHTDTIMDTLDKATELVRKCALEWFLINGFKPRN